MKTVLFALNGSYSHTSLAVRAIGAALERHEVETAIIEKTLGTACRTLRLKQNGLPTTNSCHCLRTESPFSLGRE